MFNANGTFDCVGVTEYATIATVFALCGKAFISVAFAVVYVYASEIFPTEVRNAGLGTASMCARISSIVAAYVGGPLVSTDSSLIVQDVVIQDGKHVTTTPGVGLRLLVASQRAKPRIKQFQTMSVIAIYPKAKSKDYSG